MYLFNQLLSIIACGLLAIQSFAQQPSMIVEIHGKVAEIGSLDPVGDLPMHIDNYGRLVTDPSGIFEAPVPYAAGVVKVTIEHEGYKMHTPPDGSKILSKEIQPNSIVNLNIWVTGSSVDERVQKQLDEANALVKKLRQKNEVTARQLEQLNQALIDTIHANILRRKVYEKAIADLSRDLAASQSNEEALKDTVAQFTRLIADLQKANEGILLKLTEALEERYLRQKGYLDEISRQLLTYVSRLKDYRDQLAQVDYAFKNRQAMEEFIKTITAYGAIYENVNGNQASHAGAINRYWESDALKKEYEEIVDLILTGLHRMEVLPLNDSVIKPIRDAATGRAHKPKKAKKAAESAIKKINRKIDILEPKLEQFLTSLADI